MATRADLHTAYQTARNESDEQECEDIRDTVAVVDDELRRLGVTGRLEPLDRPDRPAVKRSTRRRQDLPDLPRRPVEKRTLGQVFGGKYRPSTFLTLTLDSYGRVDGDGAAVDPDRYDYRRAARDAIHFPKILDRFWQNTRRCVGWDVQYFGTIEPQRRGAPHFHAAIRGSIPRAELRAIAAATDHGVFWPAHDEIRYAGKDVPRWDDRTNGFVDPDTREPLPTWDEATDPDTLTEPSHVVRFGVQVHVKGILGGTEEAGRHIGYLTKYLMRTSPAPPASTTTRSSANASTTTTSSPNSASRRARRAPTLRSSANGRPCGSPSGRSMGWHAPIPETCRRRGCQGPSSCRTDAPAPSDGSRDQAGNGSAARPDSVASGRAEFGGATMSYGSITLLVFGVPAVLVALWWLLVRRRPGAKKYKPVVVVTIIVMTLGGAGIYWALGYTARTTLFEILAPGSVGVSVGAPAPVHEFDVRVEHPGVEHTLNVQPVDEPTGTVTLAFSLIDPDGQVLIDEEQPFEVTTCRSGRNSRENCWRSWSGTFTPLRPGPYRLTLTILTVDVPRVRLQVVDPEKTDGVRAPGY